MARESIVAALAGVVVGGLLVGVTGTVRGATEVHGRCIQRWEVRQANGNTHLYDTDTGEVWTLAGDAFLYLGMPRRVPRAAYELHRAWKDGKWVDAPAATPTLNP